LDLLTLVRIMLRRWYVVIPVALLSLLAAGATYANIEPSYQASGSVLLLNPQSGVDPDSGRANPYVGNLEVAANVVTAVLGTNASRLEFRRQGQRGIYTLGAFPSSPIVGVTTVGETAKSARETTAAVMGAIDDVLAERQQQLGAPRSIFVTTQVVTPPSEPVPLNGSRIRASLAILALGLALTMGATFAVEGVIRQRARRHRDRQHPPAPVRGEHNAECPFCDEVLPGRDLVGHLADVHGLTGSGESPAVYALPDRRAATATDQARGTARRQSSPPA